jgi:hypothetical protein
MDRLTNDNKDGALSLLVQVEKLANDGNNQKEIAKALGFKTTFTLNNRLVKASQITGRPVPKYKSSRRNREETHRVEIVEIRRRGKGDAFGVNVPQEPLMRAGYKAGDRMRVTVRGKIISLRRATKAG